MDNDLISRSALIAEHCDGCNAIALGQCDHDVCGAAQLIMEAPAVDAVHVVRCKDCKHWKQIRDDRGLCKHETFTMDDDVIDPITEPDDFCSYGDRREDDG